jgi:hypothetical protein
VPLDPLASELVVFEVATQPYRYVPDDVIDQLRRGL